MEIIKRIAKLIDLKSIITLILTIAMVVGFFQDKVSGEKLCEFVLLVLTFYFAKVDKKEEVVKESDTKNYGENG